MTVPGESESLDRAKIEVVAKLLEKALRTEYEAEAVASLERSYRLLAELISRYDDATQGAPGVRRERRLLKDRRRDKRVAPYNSVRSASPDGGAERYREISDATSPRSEGRAPAG